MNATSGARWRATAAASISKTRTSGKKPTILSCPRAQSRFHGRQTCLRVERVHRLVLAVHPRDDDVGLSRPREHQPYDVRRQERHVARHGEGGVAAGGVESREDAAQRAAVRG